MVTTPTDVVNRARDEIGAPPIDDILNDQAALRIYDATLRQLLSAAHWNFARRELALSVLTDQTARNWLCVYEWPVDCVNARFLIYPYMWPFEIADYPIPNPPDSDWGNIEGHSPESTRVILTNAVGAELVYTGLVQYPQMWDSLFEQAMVATLAARLALPTLEDKRVAMQLRRENIEIARMALEEARLRNANEGTNVMPTFDADWIRARSVSGLLPPTTPYTQGWLPMPLIDNG